MGSRHRLRGWDRATENAVARAQESPVQFISPFTRSIGLLTQESFINNRRACYECTFLGLLFKRSEVGLESSLSTRASGGDGAGCLQNHPPKTEALTLSPTDARLPVQEDAVNTASWSVRLGRVLGTHPGWFTSNVGRRDHRVLCSSKIFPTV